MNFPDVTGTIPEDFEVPAAVAPTDDDGKPAVLDSPPTWTASDNCDLLDTNQDGTPTGDLARAVVPKLAAAAGDVISVTCTMLSEGETDVQGYVITLGGGGVSASGAALGTAVKSTRRT